MWVARELLRFAVRIAVAVVGRRVNGLGWWSTESRGFAALQAAPGPRLTATAVFVASGLLLLVVGVVL